MMFPAQQFLIRNKVFRKNNRKKKPVYFFPARLRKSTWIFSPFLFLSVKNFHAIMPAKVNLLPPIMKLKQIEIKSVSNKVSWPISDIVGNKRG